MSALLVPRNLLTGPTLLACANALCSRVPKHPEDPDAAVLYDFCLSNGVRRLAYCSLYQFRPVSCVLAHRWFVTQEVTLHQALPEIQKAVLSWIKRPTDNKYLLCYTLLRKLDGMRDKNRKMLYLVTNPHYIYVGYSTSMKRQARLMAALSEFLPEPPALS